MPSRQINEFSQKRKQKKNELVVRPGENVELVLSLFDEVGAHVLHHDVAAVLALELDEPLLKLCFGDVL